MTVYKCDICGRYMGQEESRFVFKYRQPMNGGAPDKITEKDMCKECYYTIREKLDPTFMHPPNIRANSLK